jgi:hypothetical protein
MKQPPDSRTRYLSTSSAVRGGQLSTDQGTKSVPLCASPIDLSLSHQSRGHYARFTSNPQTPSRLTSFLPPHGDVRMSPKDWRTRKDAWQSRASSSMTLHDVTLSTAIHDHSLVFVASDPEVVDYFLTPPETPKLDKPSPVNSQQD